MPVINLPDTYDAKLKRLVTDPFEQTRASIVQGLIDAAIEQLGSANGGEIHSSVTGGNGLTAAISINPSAPVSLAHTKVLAATVDGVELHKPKWNGIREFMHELAFKKFGAFAEVEHVSDANLKSGKYERDGYKYVPTMGCSIQGVDANTAWDNSYKLAKALKVPVRIEFVWREKDGAANPGKVGVIEWRDDGKSLA